MSRPPSYGYTYLTSYGWSGSGTALRNGAIAKPLTIPPKKTLSGLGNDRDEAFPFWDHLYAAASKAITIKVGDDDGDETEDPCSTDPEPVPLRRTVTGIISNRRPVEGTPASTSGTTTPNLCTDTDGLNAGAARLSLLATAKREAAKRGLYAQFLRGPVLGPDNDPPKTVSPSFSSVSTPVPEHIDEAIVEETRKGKKRKAEEGLETKEERRERKRLKRERRAAKAAKRAEKEPEHRDENQAQRKARKRARKSLEKSGGEELAAPSNRQQGGISSDGDATSVVPTTKKKKRRRKHTQS